MIKRFYSLIDMLKTFPDEQSCIDHFTAIKWAEKKQCPHCGSEKIYHFSNNRTHKCAQCRKKFSIRVGAIFEDSKIPLQKWFMAIYLTTSHKKGISSVQLAKDIDVTQKTAWFMLHRLRHASQTKSFNTPSLGIQHHVSHKHLDRYLTEFYFHCNTRMADLPIRSSFHE